MFKFKFRVVTKTIGQIKKKLNLLNKRRRNKKLIIHQHLGGLKDTCVTQQVNGLLFV